MYSDIDRAPGGCCKYSLDLLKVQIVRNEAAEAGAAIAFVKVVVSGGHGE
jgi:hypothetical protein